MHRTPRVRLSCALLCAALVFLFSTNENAASQLAAAPGAVAEVRQIVEAARKEIEAVGKTSTAPATEHPAVRWSQQLWTFRERYPRTDAATLATVEAVRLLTLAGRWAEVDARIASVEADDPAWLRLSSSVYEAGIARKDLKSAIDTLSREAAATSNPVIKAAALVTIGRAHRRAGDRAAATQALQSARGAAPGTPLAEEAEGLIYEIEHLSVGLPAPTFTAKPRQGRPIDLAALRGKPVVLVFWGTT